MPDASSVTSNGFVIDFGITGIIVIAYAAVILVLAVIALIALFKQKSILADIRETLQRQNIGAAPFVPSAPAYMPPPPAPAPNVCPKCGTPFSPGSAFCQTCGTSLQG